MPAVCPFTVTPTVGQCVAGRPQQLLGSHHRKDRDDPEHRAAIDQHQQHQHQHKRGGEQGGVDPAEHLDGVGRVPGRTRHLHLKAVIALGVRAGSDLIHRRGQRVGVARHGQRGDHEQGCPIFGRQRR